VAALVILGPERLPEAARTVGKVMAQIRQVSQGFQKEIRSAMDDVEEPIKGFGRPQLTAMDGGARPDTTDKPHSAKMADPMATLVEPEPEPGWATPPRPTLPDAPPPHPATSADRSPAAAPGPAGPPETAPLPPDVADPAPAAAPTAAERAGEGTGP
jgi:sec-independent protein translocase protein TatB